MNDICEMSVGELAAYICTQLEKDGIRCVLTGGACVSIYTDNKYESFDLDFIEAISINREKIIKSLLKIGFIEENRYFKHPDTQYFIEFPAGPLAVGREPVAQTNCMVFSTGRLFLLSPTDSVKDRLSAYYHWNDKQCLEQAVMITVNNQVDMIEIERWSANEGKIEEFNLIKKKLLCNQL